jgi:hypothetical protein
MARNAPPKRDRRHGQHRSADEPRRGQAVEARQGEPEVELALHLDDVVHVQFLLAVDRGHLLGRAEAQHALAPRDLLARGEEAAAGEEEEERAGPSTPGSPQTPAHARGERGSCGVGDELEGLEHRVLPDERVVEARE